MKDLNKFEDGITGSQNIWFAAIGPGIKKVGELTNKTEFKQNQIAATILEILDEDPQKFNNKIGKPMLEIMQ
jgi:hypothetical protein